MKKTIILALVLSLTTASLVGCTPGNNVPGATIAGATAGGLLGSALFHGPGAFAGVVGGALLGGIIGDQIGQAMDRQDRVNMQNAIVHTPINEEAQWTNPKTNVTYQVRPIKNYRSQGRYCREYQTRVQIGGEWKKAYGRACRQPDGTWKIVS